MVVVVNQGVLPENNTRKCAMIVPTTHLDDDNNMIYSVHTLLALASCLTVNPNSLHKDRQNSTADALSLNDFANSRS